MQVGEDGIQPLTQGAIPELPALVTSDDIVVLSHLDVDEGRDVDVPVDRGKDAQFLGMIQHPDDAEMAPQEMVEPVPRRILRLAEGTPAPALQPRLQLKTASIFRVFDEDGERIRRQPEVRHFATLARKGAEGGDMNRSRRVMRAAGFDVLTPET